MQTGRTPLHNAASCGDSSTVKLLLDAGAETMAKDNVSSCVAIVSDLSDVCCNSYGKHWFLFCKILLLHANVYLHKMMMMMT